MSPATRHNTLASVRVMPTLASDVKQTGEIVVISIPVAFKHEWDDGFGARGWKLAVSAHDPEIIASTAFPGESIPTSVLIHDMLDHLVSGFGPSGHRNEAMALMQLHLRTGSTIHPDIEQMIKEDILHGTVIGETLESFLPDNLIKHLPRSDIPNKEKMTGLIAKLGLDQVQASLLKRFHHLGTLGIPEAKKNWAKHRLDYSNRRAAGLCLQSLLEHADKFVTAHEACSAHGNFVVGNAVCVVRLAKPYEFHMALPVAGFAG